MGTRKVWVIVGVGVLVATLYWFFSSSAGKSTVEAIDHTADELTGKRAVDMGVPLRQDVEDIKRDQKARLEGMGLDTGSERR